MDQKGSLIDTQLRIYPSEKFKQFLNTLPTIGVTENIANLIEGKKNKKSNAHTKAVDVNLYLNNEDFENIDKIKRYLFEHGDDSKSLTDSTENDTKTHQDKEVKKNADKKSKENYIEVSNDNKENQHNHNVNTNSFKDLTKEDLEVTESDKNSEKDPEVAIKEKPKFYLTTEDIDWLYNYLLKERKTGDKDVPYLHELLEDAHIDFPKNETIKRNPELEARCVKLRAQQEARDYRKMTKTVDNVRITYPEDSISYQMKQLNRQLIAIGQFILSIFAGFMFGFRGVQWMAGDLDFGFRLMMGVMCALIIALAEIYFLAKKLNEELNASQAETVQIGGPPKLASDHSYYYSHAKSRESKNEKAHED